MDALERLIESADSTRTGLAPLADKWWVIAIVYFMAILPAAIIHNLDFISGKWRTVNRTRFLGHLHFVFAILPMPVIIFYAHLQQISKDYKEMMTAVVALFLSLYHLIRTGWGLIQLAEFSKWTTVLIQRMRRMTMMEKNGCRKSSEYCTKLIEPPFQILKLNNTIVDNELGGTDMTVKMKLNTGMLKIEEKGLCFIRWSGAFLSAYGEHWSGQFRNPIDLEELFSKCPWALCTLDLVTFPVNGRKMRFPMVEWKAGGPYNSWLDINHLGTTPVWLDNRKRELENLMSGYPGADPRQHLRQPEIILAQALLYAQSMDDISFNALIDYHSKFNGLPIDNGWYLLLWQTRELRSFFDSCTIGPISLPPFPWRKLMVPLWDKYTNWRVFQASVHADNGVHLNTGQWSERRREEDDIQPGCWFEYTRNKYAARKERSDYRYVGIILESVRNFLAHWILDPTWNSENPDWCPTIPTASFQFSTNQDVTRMDSIGLGLWRWECQSKLQEAIAIIYMDKSKLPSSSYQIPRSIELILLFILGLPGRLTKRDNPEGLEPEGFSIQTLEFIPDLAPQNITVGVEIFGVEGYREKDVTIRLNAGAFVATFQWENWINAAMGYLKAEDIKLENGNDKIPWRKRTPRKVDFKKPLVSVPTSGKKLPQLCGDVKIWKGWPFFDIKIAQFEMNEWMRAVGCPNEPTEIQQLSDDECMKFQLEVEQAEAGLFEMNESEERREARLVFLNRE